MTMNDTEFDNRLESLMAEVSGTTDVMLDELKAAAFEALLLYPGSEEGDWAQTLVEQYASEVVDAYGGDPEDAYASLEGLWETPYKDPNSGLEHTFSTWAECFCNESSVQMYYDLTSKLPKCQSQE